MCIYVSISIIILQQTMNLALYMQQLVHSAKWWHDTPAGLTHRCCELIFVHSKCISSNGVEACNHCVRDGCCIYNLHHSGARNEHTHTHSQGVAYAYIYIYVRNYSHVLIHIESLFSFALKGIRLVFCRFLSRSPPITLSLASFTICASMCVNML